MVEAVVWLSLYEGRGKDYVRDCEGVSLDAI
jgi:hypothetical protein